MIEKSELLDTVNLHFYKYIIHKETALIWSDVFLCFPLLCPVVYSRASRLGVRQLKQTCCEVLNEELESQP